MSAAAISIAILLTVSMLLTDSRLTREHLDTQLTMAHPVCLAAFLTFYIFLTCGGYPRAVNVRWTFPFLNSSVDMDSIALSGRFLSTPIFFYVKMIWQKVLQPGTCQRTSCSQHLLAQALRRGRSLLCDPHDRCLTHLHVDPSLENAHRKNIGN